LAGISASEFLGDAAHAVAFVQTVVVTVGSGVSEADISIVNVSDAVVSVSGRRVSAGSVADVSWDLQYVSEQVDASGSVSSTAASVESVLTTAISDGSFTSGLVNRSSGLAAVSVSNTSFAAPVAVVVKSAFPTYAPTEAPTDTPSSSTGVDVATYAMYGGVVFGAIVVGVCGLVLYTKCNTIKREWFVEGGEDEWEAGEGHLSVPTHGAAPAGSHSIKWWRRWLTRAQLTMTEEAFAELQERCIKVYGPGCVPYGSAEDSCGLHAHTDATEAEVNKFQLEVIEAGQVVLGDEL